MPANRVILDEASLAHRVQSGLVNVFAEPLQNGQPAGPRAYLFTATAGQLLMCGPAVESDGLRLIAVTEAADQLEEVDEPPLDNTRWVSDIEGWCERLATPIASEYPSPETRIQPGKARRCRIPEGKCFRSAARETLWLLVERGSLRLFDVPGAEIAAETGGFDASQEGGRSQWDQSVWDKSIAGGSLAGNSLGGNSRGDKSAFEESMNEASLDRIYDALGDEFDEAETAAIIPLPANCWLRAVANSRITLLTGADLPPEALRAATGRLHTLLGPALIAVQERRTLLEQKRMELRAVREERIRVEKARRLSHVVSPESNGWHGAEAGGVLAALGHEIGVPFKIPAETDLRDADAETLSRIIRNSRVRFRSVRLKDEWWRHDSGPLLTFLRENETRADRAGPA